MRLEKMADRRNGLPLFLRTRWGDAPTSPNKGDGCPFRLLALSAFEQRGLGFDNI